jgi:hypothetical protein
MYTGAANVEPAPEIEPAPVLAGVVAVVAGAAVLLLALLLELDDLLELPQAARPAASTAAEANAPIVLVVTSSPLCGLLLTSNCAQGHPADGCRGSLLIPDGLRVKIS